MADQQYGLPIVNFAQVSRSYGGRGSEAVEEAAGNDAEGAAFVGAALAVLEDAQSEPDVLCAPNDRRAALLQSFLAELAENSGKVTSVHAGALEAVFDGRDVGWVRAFIPWVRTKLDIPKRLPRPPFTDCPVRLPNDASVALLGDWGTGLYGAPSCARSIARHGGYHALVHLGDVYYTGTAHEVGKHFLDLWPRVPNAVNRACNSNHEMYSGGEGYFGKTLPHFEQPSSTFLLENDHWILAGLDTAYFEHDLDDDQVRWLDRVVDRLDGRRLVLFSHHQPFSLLASQGPLLQKRLAHLLAAGIVYAWYWGHEHLLAVYERQPAWRMNGRCVGHSGYPYFRPVLGDAPKTGLPEGLDFRTVPPRGLVPGARILDGPNEYLGDRADKYGPNGYMRLELRGSTLHEAVIAPNGVALWEQDLP
jgi:hypothetical protein